MPERKPMSSLSENFIAMTVTVSNQIIAHNASSPCVNMLYSFYFVPLEMILTRGEQLDF
jgi:hypothetical protein